MILFIFKRLRRLQEHFLRSESIFACWTSYPTQSRKSWPFLIGNDSGPHAKSWSSPRPLMMSREIPTSADGSSMSMKRGSRPDETHYGPRRKDGFSTGRGKISDGGVRTCRHRISSTIDATPDG